MNLLVTGGSGFIGSNFIHFIFEECPNSTIINVDALTYAGNPHNLTAINNIYGGKRYFFEKMDIANSTGMHSILHKYPAIDAIINFAAESHVDRSISDSLPFIMTNVLGVQNLLSLCLEHKIKRLVHVSTDEVYGSLGATGLFTEETPLAPNSPYSASKASADLLARAFFETHGLDVVVTRCSNNYGPYQFPEKLIPLMTVKAVQNEPLPIYGDGLYVRDWIHVQDHCRGILLALQKGRAGAVYNFGGQAERTNIAIVRAILAQLDRPEKLIHFVKDRPGHDRRYAMDFSLASKELGYAPQWSFEQGLSTTIQWYLNNEEWLASITSGEYRAFMEQWYEDRQ